MSQSQTESNNAGQASSYPAAYPSPSMPGMPGAQGQYPSYPPLSEGQAHPQASSTDMSSLNLPPIRSVDGRPPSQQAPQHQQAQHAGQPPPIQYYQPYPAPSSDPNQPPLRYPLPPNNSDSRIMSGGRHKKEIKRRTKTGCLTCRKRRIKCDEGHPACRNCQKSKRECLGYDPIFKAQPGPPAIQPALSAAPIMYPTSAHSSSYPPPPPHGYAPYGPPGTVSDNPASEPYDTGAPIDPALGGASRGGGESSANPNASDQYGHRAKRTKVEELLCIGGFNPPAPAPPSTIPDSIKAEIQQIWSTAYAPGMDKFFETKWFSTRGLEYLMANTRLCDQFATLIHRYTVPPTDPHYYHHLGITQSLEATVVWAMLGMCRHVSNSESSQIKEEDVREGVHDAAKRLEIFEALVTGEYLSSDSAPQSPSAKPNGSVLEGQMQTRSRDFWRLVHKFVTIRDDEASAAKEIDDTLAGCRTLLDSRENRDVTYSIMIVRHVGARMAEVLHNGLKDVGTNDEQDAKAKLKVAKDFIEDEATSKGTNQVVQRLCGMAARSWAQPRR